MPRLEAHSATTSLTIPTTIRIGPNTASTMSITLITIVASG